ncbi:DNA topoisomerase IB [Alienimonas californiensis]|uniref:DNA topoisomerase n=1 Tax=Alienimonas californiensis TaxID=2527989 RepID=A0A517PCN1_9PLAN|nr:DNA topoisomerase IB [Alienimonas californiensis]QDT17122.1 Eukaryotic DNA topoisomerase I, catalytic core [Alienimonas californiensis]
MSVRLIERAAVASIDAVEDPLRLAKRAGLHHLADDTPGIVRVRCGTGFTFRTPEGETLDRTGEERARIDALAIPPAWEEVWVSPDPISHLQATGRDAAGRKQYLYHPSWATAAGEAKWLRLAAFGAVLPRMRRRIRRDARRLRMDKRKACALAAGLLDAAAIRVGGADYTRDHQTYGLTTLRPEHVVVRGGLIRLSFLGKHGVQRDVECRRRSLARSLKTLKAAGGDTLLKYRDGAGVWRPLSSSKVNAYLSHAAAGKVTAKDFRTWHGARVAFEAALAGPADPKTDPVRAAVVAASEYLGNTAAVCREYYVHPAVTEFAAEVANGARPPRPVRLRGLRRSERRLLALLRQYAAEE